MGFLNWLKALLSRERVCCDVCREGIRPSDFVKGRALVVARKRFCRHCVEFVLRRHQRPAFPGSLEMSSSTTPLIG